MTRSCRDLNDYEIIAEAKAVVAKKRRKAAPRTPEEEERKRMVRETFSEGYNQHHFEECTIINGVGGTRNAERHD
jgi:hypothetical protein